MGPETRHDIYRNEKEENHMPDKHYVFLVGDTTAGLRMLGFLCGVIVSRSLLFA